MKGSIKVWRQRTRQRILDSMGGQCVICKSKNDLSCHHLDPAEKEESLANMTSNNASWQRIVEELRKCVMVCTDCHMDIHHRGKLVPKNAQRFDESYVTYKSPAILDREERKCQHCGTKFTELPKRKTKYCSAECSRKSKHRVNWENIDLLSLKNSGHNNCEIARMFNVTETCIRKHLKKLQ